MLEIRNVSAGYGKHQVLHRVSLTAMPGQITAILGRNGCGKSTLLKAIAGILTHTSGEVLVDGCDLKPLTPGERARRISYLAQGNGAPDVSVGRLVLQGRFPYLSYPRRYREGDFTVAEKAMEQLGILHLSDAPLETLSGGMRQKAYIAMALAQQTGVILLDEPTTYLDVGQQLQFARMLRQLAEQGKTVVLVIHDILLALKLADQICVLEEGCVKAQGSPEELLSSGVLAQLYGVKIRSVPTETGLQYYIEEG